MESSLSSARALAPKPLNLEGNAAYQFDLISVLFIMSPLVLVAGLVLIVKFPDAFARSVGRVINFFHRAKPGSKKSQL